MAKIKILRLVLIGSVLVSCSSSAKFVKTSRETTNTKTQSVSSKSTVQTPSIADKIIWSAFKYRGVPYKYGGTTSSGMDCSGLLMVSFAERGYSLPRTSYAMSKQGYSVSLQNVKRGDLLFFKTNPKKPHRISHVGLVTHTDNGVVRFIHASTKRGVTLNTMKERYYKTHFAFAKRVLD